MPRSPAHNCTGDLTGRLLEFLSCAEGVDGETDPRLPELFERIWLQRRPSGLFGRVPLDRDNGSDFDQYADLAACKVFHGMVRYYELTGDPRALEGAQGIAEAILGERDGWKAQLKKAQARMIPAWIGEPLARLYGITGDERYLDFCRMIRDSLGDCSTPCHSHGYLSTLRGLQVAALITDDASWNEKPERYRQLIAEQQYEMPDGCIPEGFPNSWRNEGCSIADWLMVNLNSGLILGADDAYEKADRILWNALAFNQWISGGFGSRGTTRNGYGTHGLEEAWWCCLHNGGLAFVEYAQHAVTLRDRAVCVNLLLPGRYALTLADGREVEVEIGTEYPAAAATVVEARGVPEDVMFKLRVPDCVSAPEVSEARTGDTVRISLTGRIGHRIEDCDPGVMLTYGPLVLAPAPYGMGTLEPPAYGDSTVPNLPKGYVPQSLPSGIAELKVGALEDADGFLELSSTPSPAWACFDEGPGARCWVPGSAVNVPVQFSDGDVREVRFAPLCYSTSNLTLWETPIVFGGVAD